ncbi:trypsin beta-like [Epargyreus clarus]|uniref:trypsin beta-like n=1 Tax=Epargyreus clarus TaxID=520877 RepID=UPI003C2D2E7E
MSRLNTRKSSNVTGGVQESEDGITDKGLYPKNRDNQCQFNSEEPYNLVPFKMNEKSKDNLYKPLPTREYLNKCGNRISQKKCCEYKWEMNNKDKILEYHKCTGQLGFQVIGGTTATIRKFPHMAAVGWTKRDGQKKIIEFKCGGSLISEKFVLTAAHCTFDTDDKTKVTSEPDLVRMGSNNLSDISGKNFKIIKKIKHPRYVPGKHYYDVALLELRTKIIFTKKIHPACLSTSIPTQDTKLNVTGWGVTHSDSKNMSDILQMATVNIVDHSVCHDKLKPTYSRKWPNLKKHQICAGVKAGGIDTCQGDSGGPLQMMIPTTSGLMHTVVGVTSMGYSCAVQDMPAIYISVAEVLNWIEETVWPED